MYGNAYFYSLGVYNAFNCFYGRNTQNRLNIYVQSGSTTNVTLHRANTYGIPSISWSTDNGYRYNTAYNIYIYPVANVEEARILNGD
jgi:hypothetical protein